MKLESIGSKSVRSVSMEIFVFGNEARRHALLVARLDNLDKGASGVAVQNLELMLRGQ
jgi:N-acetyl-gamma-glutamylphosphate reductase